ncbi:TIGR03943 family putative permease subunit [Clostridium sp. 'White wine YQ']|uniref:TIGR03943 family putative permease subunit n=1 Tax=Clostridium sp. 'White wine YQ' TaxID=3027474 RepID=UPI00236643F5|nr:TIGR03943 family protein [Clostridium sp. 'White wine YQ']MDD7796107.1 TIGR03943 family protein [Clostridium sp. 'White wine YQ']
MKRFNINEFIWFLILVFIDIYLYYLISTRKIFDYVSNKTEYYIWSAIVILAFVAIFQFFKIFTIPTREKLRKGYLIFIIAFILMINSKGIKEIDTLQFKGVTVVINNTPFEHSHSGEETIPNEGKISLTKENLYSYVEQLQENPQKYVGREAVISGVVYQVQGDENTFYIGRNVISCCIADSQNVVIICNIKEKKLPQKGQWVEVSGKIEIGSFNYKNNIIKIPIIKVNSYKNVNEE